MFFFLSKTLDVLLTPLGWAIALSVLALLWRKRSLFVAAAAMLIIFSLEPVANGLARFVEKSARDMPRPTTPVYDAVIVLGGLVNGRAEMSAGQASYNDNVERLLAAFEMLRGGRARFAILSGGPIDPPRDALIEGEVLKAQLIAWGIAPERLLVEGRSKNTRENAVETARLVHEKNFSSLVLVTSAFHMPRALDCFSAAGLSPEPWPVDFRAFDSERYPPHWLPRAEYLVQSTDALRELFGRAVYRFSK